MRSLSVREKTVNKQQLASKIWESANKMRSKIDANEYKDYILGFMFYKYLSEKEHAFLIKQGFSEDDIKTLDGNDVETTNFIQNNLGYFIAYKDLFSSWLTKGSDFNVSDVRDGLSAFEHQIDSAHRKTFSGIFDTLTSGLSKLGDNSGSQTRAIRDLLYLIKEIPMDGKQDYDVLGFVYEYLIGMFAANAGKKAGEFYTPHEVSVLMSDIIAYHLRDRCEIKIYDPTSGSGSLLLNIGKSITQHIGSADKIKYYAQELKQNTYNLTRMNLVMRGILPANIVTRNADTLEDDWPFFDDSDREGTYDPLYMDAVVSNPPYSQAWNPTNKENDSRFARFGIAPKKKADYAFLLHDLFHLKPDGIMTIVLPHGVLFRGGEEGTIRENLIENNHIDAIIGLPANIFFGTGIPTIVMVLKQKRTNTDVLFIDASKGFEKVGKNNKLRARDIQRIVDAVNNRSDHENYSRKVSREEIRSNDYNLNIPRYVDSSEKEETWDLYASMFGGIPVSEINNLGNYWTVFPNLRNELFQELDGDYYQVNTNNVKHFIETHRDISAFNQTYKQAYSGFFEKLTQTLVDNWNSVPLNRQLNDLRIDIFNRLTNISVIDPYNAFQTLNDQWEKISGDLEILQSEGFEATKIVDPALVVKKKGDKEVEIQDGWRGRLLPFNLVQQKLLADKLSTLQKFEDDKELLQTEWTEIFDNLSEEEKEEVDIFNESGSDFDVKKIKPELKDVTRKDADAFEIKLFRILDIHTELKKLNKSIKERNSELILETKKTIENLTDQQVKDFLKTKWILPLEKSLLQIPTTFIDEMLNAIESLSEKYEITFSQIDEEITATESTLAQMLGDLTGNESDMKGLQALKELLEEK